MLGGIWEEFEAFRRAGHNPVRWPGLLLALLVVPCFHFLGIVMIAPLLVAGTMLVMLAICMRKKPEWLDAAISVYPLYTVLFPLALLLLLFRSDFQPYGVQLIMLVLVIAYLGDTVAYFIGSLFGKHKLCETVSPKKTVEGALAGLGASVAGSVVFVWFTRRYVPGIGLYGAAVLGLLGGVAGQIGDLTASLAKRHCGIKDFGSIFPGHGGVMDRIDSMLFTLMVVCSYVLLVVERSM
jgi:phosphatidate cytidylyltransferase